MYIVHLLGTPPAADCVSPWNRGQIFHSPIGPSLLNWPEPISKRNTGRPMKTRDRM